MSKEDALKSLFECAKLYKENLVDKNLLFVCADKHSRTSTLSVQFSTTGFMHLTGVKFEEAKRQSPGEFFDKCLKRRLTVEEFDMAKDGTTEMKLQVLPILFAKNLSANIVGDYSARAPLLITEKLAGGVKGCMGFVFDEETGYYAPNTILNLDIRTYIENQLRVIATFRKGKDDEKYSEIVYKAKKVDWSKIKFPEEYTYLFDKVNS